MMFYYFYYLLFTLLFFTITGYLFSLDTHLIIKNEIVSKYNRWKRLNSLVSTSQKNKFTIIIVSLKLIFQAIWLSFLQSINKTVKKINKNKYELSYIIEGKLYKLIVNVKRGPSPVLQIIDHLNNDVSSDILPFLGPNYNWHNIQFTPDFFGYKSLTFEISDGTEYTVQSNNVIKSFKTV